jgi:hypothetical protein
MIFLPGKQTNKHTYTVVETLSMTKAKAKTTLIAMTTEFGRV